MDSGLFGEGSIQLDWTDVDGFPGLSPQLILKGKLTAKGYGVGAVVQIIAEVRARNTFGMNAFLGTTVPRPYSLNWVKQYYVESNPTPEDETSSDVELKLPMSPSAIEGLEERRQGKDFSLMIDMTMLLVDGGEPKGPRKQLPYATHPMRGSRDELRVDQHTWAKVLEQWERGVGISVMVPLMALEPDADRADVIRHIKSARQKIDGGDYSGSFTEARLALELIRKLSPATRPIPNDPRDRDPLQRIHGVIDALYSLASVPLHADPPIKDFVPMRADAVALVAGTASVGQQVFAWLDR
jgi:hypothetical protein